MDCFRIDTHNSTLVMACSVGFAPRFLYWGALLPSGVSAEHLSALSTRQGAPGTPDVALQPSLAMEPGLGFGGPIGFSAHRGGKDWGSLFVVTSVQASSTHLHLVCKDAQTNLQLDYQIVVDPHTGSFTLGTTLTNGGPDVVDLVEMATASLPVPQSMREIVGFTGRWAHEFHRQQVSRFSGTYLRENRRGRTSHDSFPAIILCDLHTTEAHGCAYGFHLAWSGNHRVRVDSLYDGRVFVSLGALLLGGELRLEAGARFVAPDIIASYSGQGLSGLSQNFHSHVRSNVLRAPTRAKPRLVHYNTWEAVYFNQDLERLIQLATKAASLGVERFVLDDGWFGGRRNDRAGLGDWVVSRDIYPQGLKPLVDHVTSLGMEMGIWFEPEMVNPDSDLYRAHPDWVLCVDGQPQIPFRGQFVLDISRRDVSDYLFAQIDAVLSENDIGYIKWDMNRDHNHPGNHAGFPASHAQVTALYELLDRVRHKHPHVEIESCASGGGRADYGVLAHTDRVWTSDSNDAIDRQAIQRGASHFLPLEVMGAHVGPRQCHITGRTVSMAMRAGTAIMGHMGLELNLFDESQRDLDELKSAIVLYKRHRKLLHTGAFVRLDAPAHLNCVGVICGEQTEALFSVAFLTSQLEVLPDRVHFLGLNATNNYRVRLVWPHGSSSLAAPSIIETLDLFGEGTAFPGAALIHVGLQLPLCKPETVLLFYLQAI